MEELAFANTLVHCCPGKVQLRADKWRPMSQLATGLLGNDLKWEPRKMALRAPQGEARQ